jgi:hypothetical protein
VKAPKTSTANFDLPHYGLSYLFVKVSNVATVFNLKAVITANIEFYTYSGNNGVGSFVQRNDLVR